MNSRIATFSRTTIATVAVAAVVGATAAVAGLQGSSAATSSAPVPSGSKAVAVSQPGLRSVAGDRMVSLEPVGGVSPTSTMPAYLDASLNDIQATWTRLFAERGLSAPTATTSWPAPGESVTGQCNPSNDTTMQYCRTDDTITFSQAVATSLWNGQLNNLSTTGTHGDMSVTLLLAHEFGHNVEDEIGLWDGQSKAALERGADCFAGVWANDAQARGILDDGDIDEAYAALDLVAEHPEFQVQDDIHGTPAQRVEAFEVGRTQGIDGCTNAYLGSTGPQQVGQDNSHNPIPDQGFENPVPSDNSQNPIPDQGFENPVPSDNSRNPIPDQGFENPVPSDNSHNPIPDQGFENPVPDLQDPTPRHCDQVTRDQVPSS